MFEKKNFNKSTSYNKFFLNNLNDTFYLDGNFECEKFIDIKKIANTMNLIETIDCDDTCHFEIWRK